MNPITFVHIYLLAFALVGCYFSITSQSFLFLFLYLVITAYLVFVYLMKNETLRFYSFVVLFAIQLVSVKTATLGYFFNIGPYFLFRIKTHSSVLNQIKWGFAPPDFTPLPAGSLHPLIDINLLAILALLILIVLKDKR